MCDMYGLVLIFESALMVFSLLYFGIGFSFYTPNEMFYILIRSLICYENCDILIIDEFMKVKKRIHEGKETDVRSGLFTKIGSKIS